MNFSSSIIFFYLLSFPIYEIVPPPTYTYELTVKSMTGKMEKFDLIIQSYLEPDTNKVVFRHKNLSTPYQKVLGSGDHFLQISSRKVDGVKSTIQGLINGKKKGSASGTYQHTLLEARPYGGFTATEGTLELDD